MITPITGIGIVPENIESLTIGRGPSVDFSQAIGEGLKTLNTNLNASDEVLRSVAAGDAIPLHDAMIVMTRAQISLQFAVELRNRLVESYQQLFQMQV